MKGNIIHLLFGNVAILKFKVELLFLLFLQLIWTNEAEKSFLEAPDAILESLMQELGRLKAFSFQHDDLLKVSCVMSCSWSPS